MAFRPSSTFQITFHADNLRVYNRELFDAIEAEGQKLEGHCTFNSSHCRKRCA